MTDFAFPTSTCMFAAVCLPVLREMFPMTCFGRWGSARTRWDRTTTMTATASIIAVAMTAGASNGITAVKMTRAIGGITAVAMTGASGGITAVQMPTGQTVSAAALPARASWTSPGQVAAMHLGPRLHVMLVRLQRHPPPLLSLAATASMAGALCVGGMKVTSLTLCTRTRRCCKLSECFSCVNGHV